MWMENKIITKYSEFGIDITNNKILNESINSLNDSNDIINKQSEFFHMNLLLGLKAIRDHDKNSYKRYIRNINSTKGKLNFWGEIFEVFVHSKLIKGVTKKIISNLKRGKDGLEADLEFIYNEKSLHLELTTLKVVDLPSEDAIYSKIIDRILTKNRKPYAQENCVLIIDITNLVYYSRAQDLSLKKIFKERFKGFNSQEITIHFGMIILCHSIFKTLEDGSLHHSLNPIFGLANENKALDDDLKGFLNRLFNFKEDEETHLAFYHKHI